MEIIKTGKPIRAEPGISRSIAIFTFLSDRLGWCVVTKPQREESSLKRV